MLRRLTLTLRRWGGWLLDAVYPRDCFFCGRPSGDSQICQECYERLSLARNPACLICGAESAQPEGPDFICSDCLRHRPAFARAFVAARYEGDIRDLIHAFKYHGGLWLTDDLVRILVAVYIGRIVPLRLGIDAVVPVPMLLRKRRKRGYNQAEELARLLAAQLHLPYFPKALKRVHTGVLSPRRRRQTRLRPRPRPSPLPLGARNAALHKSLLAVPLLLCGWHCGGRPMSLPTVVRNLKFVQSGILPCRMLCYSRDVSMSVICSSSFLLSLHTEAPRRFARGLFHSSLKMMKENACNLCVTCRIIRAVLTFSYTDTQPHPATDIVRAGFSLSGQGSFLPW